MDENEKIKGLLARLQQRMAELEISQSQLTEASGINQGLLSLILRGKRSPGADTLIKLASSLTTSIDYLVGRTDKAIIEAALQHDRVGQLLEEFLNLSASDQQRVIDLVHALRDAHRSKS